VWTRDKRLDEANEGLGIKYNPVIHR